MNFQDKFQKKTLLSKSSKVFFIEIIEHLSGQVAVTVQ